MYTKPTDHQSDSLDLRLLRKKKFKNTRRKTAAFWKKDGFFCRCSKSPLLLPAGKRKSYKMKEKHTHIHIRVRKLWKTYEEENEGESPVPQRPWSIFLSDIRSEVLKWKRKIYLQKISLFSFDHQMVVRLHWKVFFQGSVLYTRFFIRSQFIRSRGWFFAKNLRTG